MQNRISWSKSFQFVNVQLCWEEQIPHRHDCHDPPHAIRGGFHDDPSPPRRLPAVARADPWRNDTCSGGIPRGRNLEAKIGLGSVLAQAVGQGRSECRTACLRGLEAWLSCGYGYAGSQGSV